MSQAVRFRGVFRRLAMVDESFVEDQAGLQLGSLSPRHLDLKTAALVRVGPLAGIRVILGAVGRGRQRQQGDGGGAPPAG